MHQNQYRYNGVAPVGRSRAPTSGAVVVPQTHGHSGQMNTQYGRRAQDCVGNGNNSSTGGLLPSPATPSIHPMYGGTHYNTVSSHPASQINQVPPGSHYVQRAASHGMKPVYTMPQQQQPSSHQAMSQASNRIQIQHGDSVNSSQAPRTSYHGMYRNADPGKGVVKGYSGQRHNNSSITNTTATSSSASDYSQPSSSTSNSSVSHHARPAPPSGLHEEWVHPVPPPTPPPPPPPTSPPPSPPSPPREAGSNAAEVPILFVTLIAISVPVFFLIVVLG